MGRKELRLLGRYAAVALPSWASAKIQANRLVLLNIEEYNALCHVTDMGEDLREAKAARSERDGSQISRSRRA
jgi:hypothetical protein